MRYMALLCLQLTFGDALATCQYISIREVSVNLGDYLLQYPTLEPRGLKSTHVHKLTTVSFLPDHIPTYSVHGLEVEVIEMEVSI